MFEAQPRSSPTAIARAKSERTDSSFTIRFTGNGQSGQNLRKKNANGRHASKNASQLETTIETAPAKSRSSFMSRTCAPIRLAPRDSRDAAHGSRAQPDVAR